MRFRPEFVQWRENSVKRAKIFLKTRAAKKYKEI